MGKKRCTDWGNKIVDIGRFTKYPLIYRDILRKATGRQLLHLVRCQLGSLVGRGYVLERAEIGLTYRCQCNCAHCCSGQYPVDKGRELNTEEVCSLLERLRELGVYYVLWFGGEPTLRKDLAEITAYATSLGLFTNVDSNGILDESQIEALISAGLSRLQVSIDSADAATHDAFRGYEGAFEAACNCVKIAADRGLSCTVSVVAQREGLASGDTARVIDLARKLGASSVRLLPPISAGRWWGKEYVQLSAEDEERLWALYQPGFTYVEDPNNTARNLFHCDAAEKKIYISCYGDVQPCMFVPVSFGNVRKDDLNEVLRRMRAYPGMKPECGKCMNSCEPVREMVMDHLEKGGRLPYLVKDILP